MEELLTQPAQRAKRFRRGRVYSMKKRWVTPITAPTCLIRSQQAIPTPVMITEQNFLLPRNEFLDCHVGVASKILRYEIYKEYRDGAPGSLSHYRWPFRIRFESWTVHFSCLPGGTRLRSPYSHRQIDRPPIGPSISSVSRRMVANLLLQQFLHSRRQLRANSSLLVFEINKRFQPVRFLFADKPGPALDLGLRVIFAP
jgi:hypothetical protein